MEAKREIKIGLDMGFGYTKYAFIGTDDQQMVCGKFPSLVVADEIVGNTSSKPLKNHFGYGHRVFRVENILFNDTYSIIGKSVDNLVEYAPILVFKALETIGDDAFSIINGNSVAEIAKDDIHLAVGLPLIFMEEQYKKKFIKTLQSAKGDDIHLSNLHPHIYAQGDGVLYDIGDKMEQIDQKTLLIVDIGLLN